MANDCILNETTCFHGPLDAALDLSPAVTEVTNTRHRCYVVALTLSLPPYHFHLRIAGAVPDQYCPSSSPVGAALQAAHKDLGKVDFSTPEGLLAGLGYAITRPGHCYQLQQANLASERSGVSGVHQWSVMLPTSARVVQEVYEPLIGIQYPMLCSCKNGRWQIGTGSIRLNEKKPAGLRFVHWIYQDPREATRADPPPESARAVYLQIESWLAVQAEEPDNIPVLTTRKDSATSLRSFCHQSRRNTNIETAVNMAGATAKHCIILHGQSSFLSGHSNRSDFDKECYTRPNVRF